MALTGQAGDGPAQNVTLGQNSFNIFSEKKDENNVKNFRIFSPLFLPLSIVIMNISSWLNFKDLLLYFSK